MDPVGLIVAGGSLVVVLSALYKWVWPGFRDFFRGVAGAIDNVNGRPEKRDKANRVIAPAVPSLSVQLSDLRDAVKDQTEQTRRITAVEELTAEHGRRLDRLESTAQFERVAGHLANAATFDAIGKVAERQDRHGEHERE